MKWLQTHVWHAKRFHMERRYGCKIPIRCNQKFKRAAYKFAKHSCCLIDLSYTSVVQVNCEHDDDNAEFVNFLISHGWDEGKYLESKKLLQNSNYLSGRKMLEIILINESDQIVCPIQVLACSDIRSKFWILHSPAVQYRVLEELFEGYSFKSEDISDEINQFQLIGPENLDKLMRVLQPLLRIEKEEHANFLNSINQVPDVTQWQNGQIININGINPIQTNFRFNQRTFKEEHKRALGIAVNETQQILRQSTLPTHFKHNQRKFFGDPSSQLFHPNQRKLMARDAPTKYQTCQRTRYTHRKKIKSVSSLRDDLKSKQKAFQQEQVIEEEEQSKENDEHPQKIRSQLQDSKYQPSVKKKKIIEATKPNKSISIILIKIPSRAPDHFGSKLRIIFPKGYSLDLLRRLVYCGSKCIGIQEYEAINNELGIFNFPKDYPTSQAGVKLSEKLAEQQLLRYCRKPKNKRFNFFRSQFSMPFRSDWKRLIKSELDESVRRQLIPCLIKVQGRGVVEDLAYILKGEGIKDKQEVKEGQNGKAFTLSNLLFKGVSKEFVKILNRKEKDGNFNDDGFYTSKLLQKAKKSDVFKKIPFTKSEQKYILNDEGQQFQSLNQDYTLAIDGGEVQQNLIGFVTTGGYSYKEGGSFAKGWVIRQIVDKNLQRKQMKISIRNPRSEDFVQKYIKGKMIFIKSLYGTSII